MRNIGFGGLLHLELVEFPRDMVRILCRNFLPGSHVLRIGKHDVQLTAADVHDVFGIPYGNLQVPLSGYNDDKNLKEFWKSNYGDGKYPSVTQLFEEMFENDD